MLVGARLDELAADEEAHPWLRGVEAQGSEVSRDGLTRRRWPPQPRRRAVAEGYEGSGGKGQRARTGDEAGPLESHGAAAVESGTAAAIAGDRRSPEAARGRRRCQSQSVRRGRDARVPERESAARSMGSDRRRRPRLLFRIGARGGVGGRASGWLVSRSGLLDWLVG